MGLTDILGMASAGYGIAKDVFGINQKRDDKRQLEQQGKLSQQQADIQSKAQMDMWNNTNYGAQVEHLKKAGLNPGLLYGKGGMGGMTVGGGVSGGTASDSASTAQTGNQAMGIGMQSAMQMALLKAQKENIEADTANKEAQNPNITADTGLKGAQTTESQTRALLTEVQTEIAKLDVKLKGESLEDQLYIIEQEAHMMTGRKLQEWAKGNIAEATQETQIKLIKQELTNKALQAVAINQGVKLDQARISEITNDIQRKWEELNLSGTKTRYEHQDRLTAIKEYTKTSLQTAGIIAAGNVVGDVVRIATRQPQMKGKTTIERTDKGGWKESTTELY